MILPVINSRSPRQSGVITTLLLSLFCFSSIAIAEDVKGSKDHPLVSRYEGSEIYQYSDQAFNEYALFVSDISTNKGIEGQPDSVKWLEGRITKILYINPPERSALEVFRNYERALKDAGFETLYSCAKKQCGSHDFKRAMNGYIWLTSDNQRYMAAKLSRDDGDYYVSLYVTPSGTGGGPDYQRVLTQLHIVKVEPMEEDMVIVDADAMAKDIAELGRIALYGILFDVDKATIKPASSDTLANISTFMNENPDLKLVIVGHTDSQGSLEYNMDLSSRRAKAVEATLVRDYGIAEARLSAWGVGYLSPVASNQNEAGREKNRRVELVEK
jgi:outer membrane protein OmpA-like peptidoglycan-associated protein